MIRVISRFANRNPEEGSVFHLMFGIMGRLTLASFFHKVMENADFFFGHFDQGDDLAADSHFGILFRGGGIAAWKEASEKPAEIEKRIVINFHANS